jgi:hypothetical protein
MNKLNTLCALALLFFSFSISAQVKFKISYNQDTERYTVSVVPQTSYFTPQNITGTGQVTIKVPTNEFFPVDIESSLAGMNWDANSRNDSPAEAPDFDYISFGLSVSQGLAYPDYKQGEELPLFSFQNSFGCAGKIYLVDNDADPFMPPNSQMANVGNSLTILGAGGDAYGGIVAGGVCDCNDAGVTSVEEEAGLQSHRIFPNPATEFVNLEINWVGEKADATLQVVDATGKQVMANKLSIQKGANRQKLNVNNLAAGKYFVYLENGSWKLNLNSFTKQ